MKMRSDLEKEIEHSRAAYRFAIRSLPDPTDVRDYPLIVNGVEFVSRRQIESMLIEFGWAFYCRYEACLETFIKEHKVPLKRNFGLNDWFKEKKISVPDELKFELGEYRNIRNILHHEDGKTGQNSEIHLLPEHMDRFYDLFIWIASAVSSETRKSVG